MILSFSSKRRFEAKSTSPTYSQRRVWLGMSAAAFTINP